MKKTIITLLALAGVAAGETATLTVGTDENSTWTSGVTFDLPDDSPLTLSLTSITGAGSLNNGSDFTSRGDNLLSPKVGFGQYAYDGYIDLTFTVTADNTTSGYAWQMDSLTLSMQSVTSTGGTHSGGIGSMTVSLLSSDKSITLGTGVATLGASSAVGTATIELAESISLENEATLTLRIARTSGSNSVQGYLAVTGGSVTYTSVPVPEPATATLSLLALAGLAARRRRK